MKRKEIPEIVVLLVSLGLALVIALAGSADAAQGTYRADKDAAHEAAELLRGMGYGEDNPVIQAASAWWHETHNAQMAVYPVAAEVWQTLTGAGFSAPVAAGIIGNMMAECGGHTLALVPDLHCGQYYGLCMWDVGFTPEVDNCDVAGQLAVLLATIRGNIEQAGGDYEHFLSMTDCKAAARYFDKYYERSAGLATYQRGENAVAALSWFGG